MRGMRSLAVPSRHTACAHKVTLSLNILGFEPNNTYAKTLLTFEQLDINHFI